MNEDLKPCDHDGCNCRVPVSRDFCSESCRMAAESQIMGSTCECGHAACEQRQ
ncbi:MULTISPECIES: hypothetical protein [unclassified Luteibacter]|uniref:hypothetical protein n=1 Tax=unclassified Luteibacter TaxID=2620188 RepID=UPI0008B54169|nr:MULTISPECIES: hypothetical protein [unclassified Luteibacter]MDR6935871.1 hypothetical protein [Luteibacter sp. 3190]SEV91081.1 hypothetical protein SAMN04515660_0885 [Luteibacter sp. 329MFSha]